MLMIEVRVPLRGHESKRLQGNLYLRLSKWYGSISDCQSYVLFSVKLTHVDGYLPKLRLGSDLCCVRMNGAGSLCHITQPCQPLDQFTVISSASLSRTHVALGKIAQRSVSLEASRALYNIGRPQARANMHRNVR